MNTPTHYQDIIFETCKACLQDLCSLFAKHGITELEVTDKACTEKSVDRCYCTVYDQYTNANIEAAVERVYIKGGTLAVNYTIEGVEYYGDYDDLKFSDIPNIYDTCYSLLTK